MISTSLLRSRWFRSGGLAAAVGGLLVLAGCDDPAIPTGTPGDVEVRVFVDVEGTGSFDAGQDDPIAGVSINLVTTGGDPVDSGTTNAEGLVRFTGVTPGAYRVEHEGAAPSGAVLASARVPTVSVPAQGGTLQSAFRYVYNPGALSGVVFRDDDGSGDFTPGVDLTSEGTQLRLYRGGSASGDPHATAISDSEGAFTFGTVRPGPWTIEIDLPPPLELVGPATRSVTVTPESETFLPVIFEGDFLISIAEARSASVGTVVTVEGVVVVDQGSFGARATHLHDATGGIDVFLAGGDSGLGLQIGDSVRMVGAIGVFNGNLQLSQPSTIEMLGTGAVPDPRPISGQDMLDRTYEGELVTLGVVTIDDIDVQSFDNHNLTVTTADGSEVIIRVDSRTGIGSADWEVGSSYEVTGVLKVFNETPQLFPRLPADRAIPAPPIEIAEARAAEDGDEVTVVGVVIADQGVYDFNNRDTYIQDATGGVRLWQLDGGLELREGDVVRVSGTMNTFRDERQLNVQQVMRVGTESVPSPRRVSGQEVAALTFDGQLGVVGPLTVVEVEVFGFDAHNVIVETGDGASFEIRVDSPNEIPSSYWEVGAEYEITGVLARFFETGQIKPRGFKDVEEL
ncbi:MAG: hypothetical protein EA351_14990 [Gemmatimonadales bacterium]|nr:MAG: hypothetical protein EA351_14990 [Gemmatimonadales bacterium]